MKKKTYKFFIIAILFFAGLYSFGTTVVAADEDFERQEVTFNLIQGKESPSGSSAQNGNNGSVTKPTGKFPSTGEIVQYSLPMVGLLLVILVLLAANRRKEGDSYENE